MFRHHEPTRWTQVQFLDLMGTALQWFALGFKHDRALAYPHLMWDLLPKASASQLHPHTQASLGPHRYYGLGEDLRLAAEVYEHTHGRNYFRDLVQVHKALGLAYELGAATALAYLTPKKEYEVFIIAPEGSPDFFTLLHHVLRAYIDDLGLYAFSLAMFLPCMDPAQPSLPAIARVVDRGGCGVLG